MTRLNFSHYRISVDELKIGSLVGQSSVDSKVDLLKAFQKQEKCTIEFANWEIDGYVTAFNPLTGAFGLQFTGAPTSR